jgi:Ca2+-binding RTX toxin-like protein
METNMEGLNTATLDRETMAAIDPLTTPAETEVTSSNGSSIQDSEFSAAMNKAINESEDHDHGNPGTKAELHIDLSQVASPRELNPANVRKVRGLGSNGDFLDPGGGNNTVIGARSGDVIVGTGEGINTITTGTGKDTIVLGGETTNRIFDFNPAKDRFALAPGVDPANIVVAQGKNPGKGGLKQPFDSVNNALVIDKSDGHILATLTFAKAETITDANFIQLGNKTLDRFKNSGFSNVQEGSGQLNGSRGRDSLTGGAGDDFLYLGDDSFRFKKAASKEEFPFPTDSPGSSEVQVQMQGGVMKLQGQYKNLDAAPLFSQGEQTIDPKAKILNGSNPEALIKGFLSVPNDVEGNPLSGTHMHFSPSGDDRGNFADATVVRYFTNTPKDAKSGSISGEFELKPEEQAALLAGNLYMNLHTNVDVDGDGRAGFPTGESRINLNRNVVRFV